MKPVQGYLGLISVLLPSKLFCDQYKVLIGQVLRVEPDIKYKL